VREHPDCPREEVADQYLSGLSAVACALAIPAALVDRSTYPLVASMIWSSDGLILSPKVLTSLAMRLVRSAATAGRITDVWELGWIQARCESRPELFQLPQLFLSAQAGHPIVKEPLLFNDLRMDTLALYYSGINRLLALAFESADMAFTRAWAISKGAKDVRPAIVAGMSLSAFLSGIEFEVLIARIGKRHWHAQGAPARLWSSGATQIGLYRAFDGHILMMRARRIVAEAAAVTERIGLDKLARMCELDRRSIAKLVQDMIEIDLVMRVPPQPMGKADSRLGTPSAGSRVLRKKGVRSSRCRSGELAPTCPEAGSRSSQRRRGETSPNGSRDV